MLKVGAGILTCQHVSVQTWMSSVSMPSRMDRLNVKFCSNPAKNQEGVCSVMAFLRIFLYKVRVLVIMKFQNLYYEVPIVNTAHCRTGAILRSMLIFYQIRAFIYCY